MFCVSGKCHLHLLCKWLILNFCFDRIYWIQYLLLSFSIFRLFLKAVPTFAMSMANGKQWHGVPKSWAWMMPPLTMLVLTEFLLTRTIRKLFFSHLFPEAFLVLLMFGKPEEHIKMTDNFNEFTLSCQLWYKDVLVYHQTW